VSEDIDWSGLDPDTAVTGPFAAGWGELYDAGWPVLPVGRVGGPLAKNPPMTGRTGHHGTDLHRTGAEDLSAAGWGVCNIAVRMPPGVLGLDVDAYHGGSVTLAEMEERLGPLPVAPVSTARTDGSGIRFFRVPVDWVGVGGVTGIELIQRHHRFAVVAPSVHPKLGEEYRWLGGGVPRVVDLPWLPPGWLAELDAGERAVVHKRVSGADVSGMGGDWLDGLDDLDPCVLVSEALHRRVEAIEDELGSRFDQMRSGIYELVMLHIEGHRGAGSALHELRDVYGGAVSGERPAEWEGEWTRALDGAVGKLGPELGGDPCECLTDEEIAETLRVWTREAAVADADADADADAPAADGRYLPLSDPGFWARPDPVFVVPGLVVQGASTSLYSAPGQGKSLLAQDAALGLAVSGVLFGGAVEREPVMYVDHENGEEDFRARARSLGLGPDSDWSLLHYSLLFHWKPLDTAAGGAELTSEAMRLGVRLVVLDTLSKTIDGDENSNDTFARFQRHTLRLLKRVGIGVLLLDHSGKDASRGTRGASAKLGNVDAQYLLSSAGSGPVYVSLFLEKNRSGMFPERLDYERRGALHHPVATLPAAAAAEFELEDKAREVISLLDAEALPEDWGRVKIRGWLKEHQPLFRVSDKVLERAVRMRKEPA